MRVEVLPLVDEGLGNTTWLVDLGDGRALAVDASRDLRSVRAEAERRRLTVAFAADTHLHADFITGAVDLAAGGARLLASRAGARSYDHVGLADGDEVDLGGLTLRALLTPGHTDEHLAFLLLDGDREVGVFTGGSLIVGAAARTDLLGADRTEELARLQWQSLQRLTALPDHVQVWPTHGAGSFCSAPPGAARSSTIGQEKEHNGLLRAGNEQAFVDALVASLGSYPTYFARLGEVNRSGVRPLRFQPRLDALSPEQLGAAVAGGAVVVDVRPVEAFAAAHVPGALSIPLRPVFGTWLGWTVPAQTPVVIVRDAEQDLEEVVWQALKVGHERLAGELAGGLPAWVADGRPVARTETVDAGDVDARAVVDVRQRSEFAGGHLPRARNVELGELAGTSQVPGLDGAAVMCGHGERAMTAASLLERAGTQGLSVVLGGPDDWAARPGRTLLSTP